MIIIRREQNLTLIKMDKKVILDYFRSNLFEAFAAYNAWKTLAFSKSTELLGQEKANKYVKIQNYHAQFFTITEKSLMVNFIVSTLHAFDKHYKEPYSLYLYDDEKTKEFVAANKVIIDELFSVRNKVLAHRDQDAQNYKIPSVERMDKFYISMFKFYNELTNEFERSSTMFDNAEEVSRDIENLFMNLERGETIRLKEIDIKWLWEQDDKKISDII